MKKIVLALWLAIGILNTQAGGSHSAAWHSSGGYHGNGHSSGSWNSSGAHHWNGNYSGGHYYYPYHSHYGSSTSFSFAFGYPFYGAAYYPSYSYYYPPYPSYSYAYYPGYAAYPAYSSYYGYAPAPVYGRPNYAVTGTLLGAGIGAIVGNNVHHQTWQGAAIGAGAGLLLGGLTESRVRAHEQSYVAMAPPMVAGVQPNAIADAPTVPDAPRVADYTAARPAGAMSGANGLFGR